MKMPSQVMAEEMRATLDEAHAIIESSTHKECSCEEYQCPCHAELEQLRQAVREFLASCHPATMGGRRGPTHYIDEERLEEMRRLVQ